MRKPISILLLFLLLLMISACGSTPTPTESAVEKSTSTSIPTSTQAQLAEPTITATLPPESSPTAVPTNPVEASPTPLPSPTATQEPTMEAPTPTEAVSPTAQTDNTTPESNQAACINKAAFYDDVTIPDDTVMRQGQTFTKTWRIRNEGSCTWTGYKLVYAGGEAMNANPANDIDTVEPEAIVDISVDMQAPNRGGSHTSFWQFASDSGETFGVGAGADGLLWVRITVDYGSQTQDQASTGTSTTTSQNTSTSTTSTTAGCSYETNASYIDTILNLVNNARSSAGLNTLTIDDRLSAAALEHSQDMACNDFISHTGSDGSLWYQRVASQGYANSTTARENIYVGNPAFGGDAQGAFDWWMNSQIHRDNILYPSVTQIGIAYVYNAVSTYGGYYTLIVARP